jgi:uncharacterized protein (DUF1330 family)
MQLENKIHHSIEQWEALAKQNDDGPVCMINLLKFKDKASYSDGRESDLTGLEAYQIYSANTRDLVEEAGGKILHTSIIEGMIVGEVEELWDVAAIVEYPSIKSFMDMVNSHEWKEYSIHKEAGLSGQLNILSRIPSL